MTAVDTLTAGLLAFAIFLVFSLILVALYRKGDLRAGAKFGLGSFFLEVREKKSNSSDLPS